MSKPKWSVNAFARRMQMGEHDFWVIVEGRDHDRPHYDKLLKKLPSTRDLKAQLRLAEEINVGGTSAGGKKHVLAIHDHLESKNKLVQSNSKRTVRAVFMLDRDRDDFEGILSTSPHVMYTIGTDVEADILLNSEIWSAVRSAYGIDSRLTKRLRRKAANPAIALRTLWDDWLRLGLVGLACGSPGCAPWSQHSRVNVGEFGTLNSQKVHDVEAALLAAAPSDYASMNRRALRHVSTREELLLKGRWIAKFINYLVRIHLAGEVVRSVQAHAVIDTALAQLKYRGDWVTEYDRRFAQLLV
ncbi:hypothetical protein NFX31_06065 [Microbacterium azadirachtae]|uniref:hypothetical protein n=1 Tax=Microbacterium azadirachtae TaxID=582680 RepID=UPI0021D4B01B|nr:hypothetical protein [Microbacterium azadirachtae]UXW87087.1 hypothetical protein NFX31_06065 [Microbacterium azadirachtae]